MINKYRSYRYLTIIGMICVNIYSFGQTREVNQKPNSTIQFSVELLNSSSVNDTVTLNISGEFGSGNLLLMNDSSITRIAKSHRFNFKFHSETSPRYISLSIGPPYWQNGQEILPQEPIFQGDSIHLVYNCKTKQKYFTGRGSEKFVWLGQMEKADVRLRDSLPKYSFDRQPAQWIGVEDFRLKYHTNKLEASKKQFDDFTYKILKADLIAQNRSIIYDVMRAWNFGIGYERPQLDSVYTADFYNKPLDTASSDQLAKSGFYSIFLVNKLRTDQVYREDHHLAQKTDVYYTIKDDFSNGNLKDKMLVTLLFGKYTFQELSDSLLSDAIKITQNEAYVNILKALQKKVGSGEPITGFSFEDRNGNTVKLKDLKNKVIFVDMWFTGCAGCIQVAKGLPKVEKAFTDNANVVFVSLSIDKNKQSWLKSIHSEQNSKGTYFITPKTLYLYTSGTGSDNEFIKRYNASNAYPCIILISKKGTMYSSSPPRPDSAAGCTSLIKLIRNAMKE